MISNEIILGILWIGEANKKSREIGDRRRGRDERLRDWIWDMGNGRKGKSEKGCRGRRKGRRGYGNGVKEGKGEEERVEWGK